MTAWTLPDDVAGGPTPSDLVQLVDFSRYPISPGHTPAYEALVAACRRELADDGTCVLPSFVLAAAVTRMLEDVEQRIGDAYYCQNTHNPYLTANDERYPADHPRNRAQISDVGCLADDQIPEGSSLRTLYQSPELRAFIADILGVERLHPYADPLGSLNVNVYQPSQQLGWHFDNADYATTIMLQPAESGGVYEYVPFARSPEDESYSTVAAALDGHCERVRRLAMDGGALVLFRGRYSLHRVTPVQGLRPRVIAVLSYDTEPGVMLTEFNRQLFYGRIA